MAGAFDRLWKATRSEREPRPTRDPEPQRKGPDRYPEREAPGRREYPLRDDPVPSRIDRLPGDDGKNP